MDRPDIELGARVKAKRLRFERKADVETATEGEWDSEDERRNLPDEVEPGVTYRDVEIVRRAAGRVSRAR
jgi:hypothetical protein